MPGFVNPIGAGLQPARIDMGVDYTGTGSLYALGSGKITSVYNSGWPGGKFIGLHLDTGQYMYYAENIIPHVSVGQRVTAGQLVGTAVGTAPFIEVGWAAPPGTGETMAAQAGQSALGQSQGDPGKYPTGYGVSMSNLIKSLGGPAGQLDGPIQGAIPGGSSGGVVTPGNVAGTDALSALGCVPFIGYIWLVCHAVQYRIERRRNLSSHKLSHRKGARKTYQ